MGRVSVILKIGIKDLLEPNPMISAGEDNSNDSFHFFNGLCARHCAKHLTVISHWVLPVAP